MGFPAVPTELQTTWNGGMYYLSQTVVFQMKTHFMGGHKRVVGNVVNVPVDVAPTVETLPKVFMTQTPL